MILPAADTALSAALDELDTARRQLDIWGAEAANLAETVFDTDTNTLLARQSIIDAGQLTRLRAETAAQLDDLGYIIRTRFPYPVALRWRESEVRESAGDDARAYAAVLEAAEILLAHSALLVLALAQEASVELSSATALRTKLTGERGGGPGLGEWTAILQEIAGAKKRRGLGSDHPLHELGNLLSSEAAQKARKRIAGRRNAASHLRPVDPLDLPAALQETLDDLRLLVARARFLADWPLVQVTSVAWDSFRNESTLSVRQLMGDHPVVPTSTMKYRSSAVEQGSLYLVDRDHRLYLLRPFLVGQLCPLCRNWSTFHVDKVDGELVLKSLEHGHWFVYQGDLDSLKQVGLQ
ncbi:hypothetical protein [Actinocorallia aurea]